MQGVKFVADPRARRAAERMQKRVLMKQGALVRKIARQSIRKRKKVSDPNKPPTSRTGALKNFILFALDGRKSVVIGPKILSKEIRRQPTRLEQGGTGKVYSDPRTGETRVVRIRKRPFMEPALAKAKPYLTDIYKNQYR